MTTLHLCALLFGFFLVTEAKVKDKKPDPIAERKALVGKWKIVKMELGGEDATEEMKKQKVEAYIEITPGGRLIIKAQGAALEEATFTIDPLKKPKEMNLMPTSGKDKGETIKAIYKIDEGTLTICYEKIGFVGERPTRFVSEKNVGGTKLLLITCKREKNETDEKKPER